MRIYNISIVGEVLIVASLIFSLGAVLNNFVTDELRKEG